jgi:RNA polymerase sigma-70 factor (ECF subfamily)
VSRPPEGRNGPLDLDRLYREEAPRLARYFRRHTRGDEDVPDLVQDSFVRLAALDRSADCKRPAAYLQRIARNLLVDRSRRRRDRLARLRLDPTAVDGLVMAADQGCGIEHDDVMRLYRQTLYAMPERTRTVFLLHRVDDLPYREIGKRLNIAIPTVQYHVAQALMHLDRALGQE